MINLKDLRHNYISKKQNELIRMFLASIITDRGLLKNKHKLFYNQQELGIEKAFRVLDDKLFLSYKPKAYKIFQFEPDGGVVKEFFDNKPFKLELPVVISENKKNIRSDMLLKWFIGPLAKNKNIDDLLFIILKNIITLLGVYYDEETGEIGFGDKQIANKAKVFTKFVNYKVKEITLEEVLQSEVEQGFVNKVVGDANREYAYSHLLREHAKFRLFGWSKNVLINWRKYNVLATSRSYGKTMFGAFIGARGLLDTRPGFGGRHYREIKIFVPNKEDIGNQYMTYIKSMIGDLKHVKLDNGLKAFEINTWSIKCNITGNVLKIISLNNIDKEGKGELGTARGEGLACDLAIIDEAARIPNKFWISFHQRAAFETQEFYITSTINEETPVDHWFYELLIDGESGEETISSYRLDIEHNEAMMIGKTEEEFKKQLETVKETLRKGGDKEFYSKGYCIILEESNVFNITNAVTASNDSKYQDTDVRILGFDLGKLDDSAALILINLTHREIESAIPIYNATYGTQLEYAEEYKKKYKNILIIGDRSGVGEAVSEQDTKGVVDTWIKSTGTGGLSYNNKGYYTCSKGLIITTAATIFNLGLIKIPAHNQLLIEQINNFVKMKSGRGEVILYKGKGKTKDDLVLATSYALLYIYSILGLKSIKEIEDYVKSIGYNQTYIYNDESNYSSSNDYYNGYY